jgi:hypothetical protein
MPTYSWFRRSHLRSLKFIHLHQFGRVRDNAGRIPVLPLWPFGARVYLLNIFIHTNSHICIPHSPSPLLVWVSSPSTWQASYIFSTTGVTRYVRYTTERFYRSIEENSTRPRRGFLSRHSQVLPSLQSRAPWITAVSPADSSPTSSILSFFSCLIIRDHWQDVLAGSILGTVISYFAYRQYYPSLASEVSHRPYAPRIPREELPRQTRLRHAYGERSSQQKDRDHAEDIIESGPLEGTVIRGGPSTLREVWSDGADREGTTALDSPGGAHDGIPLESV